MGRFLGGSAWAMARDIARGHILLTDRSLARFSASELQQLGFEVDRALRQLRGTAPDLDDTLEVQRRNQTITRLVQAQRLIRNRQVVRPRRA